VVGIYPCRGPFSRSRRSVYVCHLGGGSPLRLAGHAVSGA
jgi:hypothetical protein